MNAVFRSQCACYQVLTPLHRSTRPCVSRNHQRPQQRRMLDQIRASGGQGSAPNLSDGNGRSPQSIIKESDVAFVGKLAVLSVVGGLVIKYGSLLISLPFEPNAAVALGLVLGTPAVYSLYLLTQSPKQQ